MSKKTIATELTSEEQILEAYFNLALEKGVADITLQELAQKAKVAFGTVRYHFAGEGKDILQFALRYLITKA